MVKSQEEFLFPVFLSSLRLRRSFFLQPRSVSAPLPRRGHRSQFILPTPLPGARYSLRLAIPSSLCLSYHSAKPELQCGYPPFTAHPPCARRRRHRAVETLLICLGCILFSQVEKVSHILEFLT